MRTFLHLQKIERKKIVFFVCFRSTRISFSIFLLFSFSQKLWQRPARKCSSKETESLKRQPRKVRDAVKATHKVVSCDCKVNFKWTSFFYQFFVFVFIKVITKSTMQPQQKMSPFAKFRQLDRQNSLPKWVKIERVWLIISEMWCQLDQRLISRLDNKIKNR